MKYCSRCVLPDTRPHLVIDESGVCNACRAHGTKKEVDWNKREKQFLNIVQNAKQRSKGYDCLIPVSGGKDSHWQVIQCLKYGLNPLAVTWKTPARTPLGRQNLDNLVHLGVDHIDYQVNPNVERKFMWAALERYGSTAIPMHMAMFNIPLTIAVKFSIPLVVWCENSVFEYGGPEEEWTGFKLDPAWLKKFSVMHGTSAEDWISDDLTRSELTPYFGPSTNELATQGILAIFLAYYFSWDTELTCRVAKEHGFLSSSSGPKTGYYDFASIDCDFISIHHHLKWYKFGITRMFDNLSIEIRNGRISREDAIRIIREKGDQTPVKDIKKFCDFVNKTPEQFFGLIEKFRNRDIWYRERGTWKIKNFIIPDWKW